MVFASGRRTQQCDTILRNKSNLRRPRIDPDPRRFRRWDVADRCKSLQHKLQEVAHATANHSAHYAAILDFSRLARIRRIAERFSSVGCRRNDHRNAAFVPRERLFFRQPDDIGRCRLTFQRMKTTTTRLEARPTAFSEYIAFDRYPCTCANFLGNVHTKNALVFCSLRTRFASTDKAFSRITMNVGYRVQSVLRQTP